MGLDGFSFRYSARIDAALIFAAEQHAPQTRKGTSTPYIVHPVHVAWLLQAYQLDEDTVVAGILHDLIEDTPCTREEILTRFGEQVARTVDACSESDKSATWEDRKAASVERMRSMSESARAVSCADKAHNLHSMADALEREEKHFWDRFKRGPDEQLDYHRRALAALGTGWDHAILGELRSALRRLEAAVGAQEA